MRNTPGVMYADNTEFDGMLVAEYPKKNAPRNVYKVVHAESKAIPFLFLILTPNLNPIAICTPESALNVAVEKGDI